MSVEIRRIVTGHDETGRAVVQIDDGCPSRIAPGTGVEAIQVWKTEGYPVDNQGGEDMGAPFAGLLRNGTIFRVVSFGAGYTPRRHRTESIDYVVIISGEIDMELEPGEIVRVKAGDLVVQRGTVHAWINRGTEPCVMALVMIGAEPVQVGGKVLGTEG